VRTVQESCVADEEQVTGAVSDGKSIRLFLADGTSGGLLTAEIMNWTGHVVAAPRSDLAALLRRPGTSRTGIYILLGDDPESFGGTLAYVGEGDEVRTRLRQHARAEEQGGKDFWDRAIVLTNKDANLTKAHARYLESRLITLAQRARRSRLINGTVPPPLPLPEADISDMEYFIAQAKIILPVLGVNILRSTAAAVRHAADTEPASAAVSSPVFELHVKRDGITATAREIDGEFTVLEGSGARAAWTVWSTRTRSCARNLSGRARSFPATMAGRCDSPATRSLPAPAPRQPSWWDGPRTGAATGGSKARVSASATGRPRVLSKLPERDRREQAG
jgi:hypothetical protein